MPPSVMAAGGGRALLEQILLQAQSFPWSMQEIGLLGLRLDDRRELRLHVWDSSRCVGEPPIHDHPFDFVSQVVAGEMINTRYRVDPAGREYRRVRYAPGDESARSTADSIRLLPTATTYREGECYRQLASELHDSRQLPGTVTIIRMLPRDVAMLSVCRSDDADWVSGRSRAATPAEIASFTERALSWF